MTFSDNDAEKRRKAKIFIPRKEENEWKPINIQSWFGSNYNNNLF